MAVFSYGFFGIWLAALVVYFSAGSKWQWQILTVTSVLFYALSIEKAPVVLLVVWPTTYLSARFTANNKNAKGRISFFLGVLISTGMLLFGRMTSSVALLGNSYFTLKAIGYLIDVYRDMPEEKNVWKYLLYLIYWPTVSEGPFNRIGSFEKAIKHTPPRTFRYEDLAHGVQRFLWGVFKKLVIAERLSLLVTGILTEPAGKGGSFVVIAVLAFAVQLYADFSGFMDMMLGVSCTFGIELPENFRQPYFAKSIPEFWRRWHITLGLWFRDYIMFPFTGFSPIKKLSKKIRKKNRTWGKLFPLLLGTCIVWLLTGLWHGLSGNYLVWGLYYALLMCCSQIFAAKKEENAEKWNKPVGDLVAVSRTVMLVLIADTFICVQGLSSVAALWKEILFHFWGGSGTVEIAAGFSWSESIVLVMGMGVMLLVSLIKEKGGSPQDILDKSPLVIRWGVYYVLVYAILIYGIYGSQYDVSQFLYMQF